MYIKDKISHELEHLMEEKEGTKIKIGGIIESSRRIFTKKNNSEMAFLVIANEKGISVECVVFPRIFEQYKSLLVKDSVIIIEGHLDTKNDRPSIIAEKISQVNIEIS
jgi:DNA polymerase III subunit alpha